MRLELIICIYAGKFLCDGFGTFEKSAINKLRSMLVLIVS